MDLERAGAPSPFQPQQRRLDELLADTLETMARAETTPRTAPLAVYDALMHEAVENLKTARKASVPPGALAARYEELLPFYHDVWQTLQNSPLNALQDFGLRQSSMEVEPSLRARPSSGE
jgi:hypothetical protein